MIKQPKWHIKKSEALIVGKICGYTQFTADSSPNLGSHNLGLKVDSNVRKLLRSYTERVESLPLIGPKLDHRFVLYPSAPSNIGHLNSELMRLTITFNCDGCPSSTDNVPIQPHSVGHSKKGLFRPKSIPFSIP